MPVYTSKISNDLKRKFLDKLLNRHGIKMLPDSSLTRREVLVLSLARNNDLEHLRINTKWWGLNSKPHKGLYRDDICRKLGLSKSTVTRTFSSLEKKGRVFYDRQIGKILYIPDEQEVIFLPAYKLSLNHK